MTSRGRRGSPSPSLALGALAVLAASVAALAPGASAQVAGQAGILETTYGLEVLVPTGALEEVLETGDPPQEVPQAGIELPQQSCGTNHLTLNATDNWFRFRETQYENGCAEARYRLAVPAGASTAVIRFRADRAILQPSSLLLPINMQQELRVYDDAGDLVATFPFYEPDAPQHLEAEEFSYPVEVAAGQPTLTVGWFFRDRGSATGQAAINPLVGQAFSATVRDAAIDIDGIPLAPERVEEERLGLQGDAVRRATTVVARVPDTLGVSGRINVNVRVAEPLTFSHALGPLGETVADDLVARTAEGDVTTVVLEGEATARHGPGLYRLVFTSTTPLEPSPLLYPFVATVLAVPAGAGVLALRSTRQFRRQATPEFAATAANLDHGVLAMLGAYLLLPIGVLVSGRLPLLTSWPLEGEAGLVYLLIGLSFVAFLAVGFVGRRHLGTLMHEEQALQERARRELERSNRELAEFAYVASHDLQEPLRTVASYTQLLQRRYKGRLDKDADEFIDSAVEGAQRMQLLIQDLLAYSRVGSKPEAPVAVDLGAVVDDVRRLLSMAISDAKAEVVVTKALPTVLGNERQFTQLLQNLIANAIKFRQADRPPRVEVFAEEVPGGWRVSVKDNGIGIDPSHFDRVFQIFQRLHERDAYPGTGIGLAICKRIVELNGGRIGVESVPGQGSTFWFTVPERPLPGRPGPANTGSA
jgi:signal transduction histidine kinase